MNRRSKQARLLTGGLIGALPVTTPGDEHWDDVSLLIRGDTLTDLSANGHTVSENGSTPLSNDKTISDPYGGSTGSFKFDGAGDYIDIPDDPSLELGSSDFTIECWAYHSGTLPTKASITGKRSSYSDYTPYLLNSGVNAGEGKMRFLASAGSSWDIILTDTDAFPINQWVHVAATRKDDTFTLWINGQSKVTTTSAITLMDNSAPMTIGRASVTTGSDLNDWDGYIADFRVTKGFARYTAAFTPPTRSLPTVLAGTPEATATLRTRGYIGAAPAGGGGMLTLYDRYVDRISANT